MVLQTFYSIKHKFFPSFEPKRYHLQFRHAALVVIGLTTASFVFPSFHQTKKWEDSDYFGSPDLPVESSYQGLYRFTRHILYYNEAIALWIALCLVAEGVFQRSAPVWFELTWMPLVIIGEIVCLGLMASSRPAACDYSFGVDMEVPDNGKLSPQNSITSLCSNWRGMTGMLATLTAFFILHFVWHVIIAARYMSSRPGYFTTPIPDYRWTLSAPRERLAPKHTPTDVERAAAKEKQIEATSADFTSRGTDSFSFPLTPTQEEYSNFSRLPANSKPVVLVQSTTSKSDTSSIVEVDPKTNAPFSYSPK
ncbi:hypothetical protein RSOLAG22IIIB_14024 [Rhizoctonia solani]|uniref:Uncharacterized protein n=1 Tax=Rhizoctonia solani TaxID=456999 RepID=A0A0K6FTK2_9AGAM|nr:hypothetical protein RSOLAG22IIIB_14024 [Rhizoctonia solani]